MSESDPKDPPDTPEPPAKVTRRSVLDLALTATAGGIGVATMVPVVRFSRPPHAPAFGAPGVVAGRREEFTEHTSRVVMLDDDPVIVIALPGGEIRAFGARCTHLECVVGFNRASELFECPCHGGRYAPDGRVVAGPPPAPLREYRIEIRGAEVVVVRG